MTAVIGYARISTEDQNLDLQSDALTRAGCTRIYEDRKSGAKPERHGLTLALEMVHAGDQLVVWRLDRLGRSLSDLIDLIRERTQAGLPAARARSRKGGRPKSLDTEKRQHAVALYRGRQHTIA